MRKYLTQLDIDTFESYCTLYAPKQNSFIAAEEYLEQFWYPNKKDIIKNWFKGQVILEKEVELKADEELLYCKTEELMRKYHELLDYCYIQFCKNFTISCTNTEYWEPGFLSITAPCNIYTNKFYTQGGDNSYIIKHKETGKKKQFQSNKSKLIKFLSFILKNSQENIEMLELLEKFRIEQSQIIQQKFFKGTLCLSVHPMDYATMSDNCENWHSCMSWQQDGCYRAGTIEMMNSPIVVVGYLKSEDHSLQFDGYNWNSKIWRSLFIINENIITNIKGYPYQNEELSKACVDWLLDLAPYDFDTREFHDEKYDDDPHMVIYSHSKFPYSIPIFFETNLMYNDIGYMEFYSARFSKNFLNLVKECPDEEYTIEYSGENACVNCGKEITETGSVLCNTCYPHEHCQCCGDRIDTLETEDYYMDSHDNYYCPDCWSKISKNCDWCGDSALEEDMCPIYFNYKGKVLTAYLCPYCHDWFSKAGKIDEKDYIVLNKYTRADFLSLFANDIDRSEIIDDETLNQCKD